MRKVFFSHIRVPTERRALERCTHMPSESAAQSRMRQIFTFFELLNCKTIHSWISPEIKFQPFVSNFMVKLVLCIWDTRDKYLCHISLRLLERLPSGVCCCICRRASTLTAESPSSLCSFLRRRVSRWAWRATAASSFLTLVIVENSTRTYVKAAHLNCRHFLLVYLFLLQFRFNEPQFCFKGKPFLCSACARGRRKHLTTVSQVSSNQNWWHQRTHHSRRTQVVEESQERRSGTYKNAKFTYILSNNKFPTWNANGVSIHCFCWLSDKHLSAAVLMEQ